MKYILVLLIGLNFGLFYGGFYVYFRMRKMLLKVAEESLLRTNLINWITKEGLYLPSDEFYIQFQEKAKFINLMSG